MDRAYITDKVVLGIFILVMVIVAVVAVIMTNVSGSTFKTTDEMIGRAQFVKFEGMNCIEYTKGTHGGSLDCDWNSKGK